MWRKLLKLVSATSFTLCLATAVLWAARLNHPRVGSGCRIFGNRYTLSLLPDRLAILGPPPVTTDPATRRRINQFAQALHASGGTFWYHGTTGGMGFGGFFFGKTLDAYPETTTFGMSNDSTLTRAGVLDKATIPTLMATLEDDRLFLISHALLTYTNAGERAADYPTAGMKYRLQYTEVPRHRTDVYDSVPIDLVEDRPERDAGSWGSEIWAVVTTNGTAEIRARVRNQWHARLDEPIATFHYWRVLCLTFLVSAATFAPHWADHRRRKRRSAGLLCLSCGYNLTGNTSGTCPECGTAVPKTSRLV